MNINVPPIVNGRRTFVFFFLSIDCVMAVNNSAPIERCHESRILVIPKNGIRLETSPGDPYIFAKD